MISLPSRLVTDGPFSRPHRSFRYRLCSVSLKPRPVSNGLRSILQRRAVVDMPLFCSRTKPALACSQWVRAVNGARRVQAIIGTGAFMEPFGRPLFLPSIVIYVGATPQILPFSVWRPEGLRQSRMLHVHFPHSSL